MKKYYLFAALATAGLFAGCSSDDTLSLSEGNFAPVNDNEKVAIQLQVGNPSSTRGTGTVGGVKDAEDNVWAGQKFNVYMLKKGELTIATDAEGNSIYENSVFTAPDQTKGQNGPAIEIDSEEDGGFYEVVKYFPQDGVFDFWAYRLDDAANGKPEEEGDALKVDFEINGSQDIMVAKAVPSIENEAVSEERIFSAYAARRDVKPKFVFDHLLTRLAFKIKASKSLSNTLDEEQNVVVNEEAVAVTGITVKSLNKGKLKVAYTGETPTKEDGTTDLAQLIEWQNDGAPEDSAALELKQRGVDYEQADIEKQTLSGVGLPPNRNTLTFPSGETMLILENTKVYTSDATDKKGYLDEANAITAKEADERGIWATCWVYRTITDAKANEPFAGAELEKLEPVTAIYEDDNSKTPVGEALLVAPQESYEVTVHTSQKVYTKKYVYYCTVEQEINGTKYYFKDQADADAAKQAADENDEEALAKALAKGTKTENGMGVDLEKSEWKSLESSQTLILGNTTQQGSQTVYTALEPGKTYTVTITLTGQASVMGDGNVDVGGYVEGEELELDMDK